MARKKEIIIFAVILSLFLLTRLPGIHFSYFQDERKYIGIGQRTLEGIVNTAHPPLTEIIMAGTSKIFGSDNFRAMPLIFSTAGLFLLYFFVRRNFGVKTALWSSFLFTVSFYSVLASLTVDVDGGVMPFFFLLTLISYFEWRRAENKRSKIYWGTAVAVAILLGFLVKLSFIIVAGALIIEFLWSKKNLLSKKFLLKWGVLSLGFLGFLGAVLVGINHFSSFFDLSRTISHATDYFHIEGRSYLQILIQVSKAIFYASPLLIATSLFISRKRFKDLRIFYIFLVLSFIFYIILFDFSRAALDKYLALIIVPLSIIAGVAVADILYPNSLSEALSEKAHPNIKQFLRQNTKLIFWASYTVAGLIFLQFLPHVAPPQYPKEEWLGRILSLKWNFLFPFTGGSGPLGFYISWLFIGIAWVLALLFAVLYFWKKKLGKNLIVLVLAVGLAYNFIFIEEFLVGNFNGNPYMLLKDSVEFIKNDNNIKSVITYRDIAGKELSDIGKFEYRIYAIPKFEDVHVNTLNNFKGHYLVINIPKIEENSLYTRYFDTCEIIYEKWSGKIPARVYDCREAEDAIP
ncbi:MAG: glycosyltransferase family 39 protein [bacterium]|nr:glycosyltransferase family 39 protein [bacterium]